MKRLTFNLRLWFGIAGFGVITVLAVAFALLMSAFVTRVMLQRDVEVTQDFLISILLAEGSADAVFAKSAATHDAELASFADHIRWMPDVLRANVYGADGNILWSTEAMLIGQHFHDNSELEDALAGKLVHEVGRLGHTDKAEHVALTAGSTGYFIEAYLPMQVDGRVHGAVELYKVPVALDAAIDRGQMIIWSSAAAGAIVLFATLFWIVQRGARVIQRQQTELGRMEALAALGQMAGAVAHNLRNPMAGIRSSAELLRLEHPVAMPASDEIIGEIDRLECCIQELLQYTRSETPAVQRIDPAALVEEALSRHRLTSERYGVALVLNDLRRASCLIDVDPLLLSQAISSIVANAVEAMPEGGRLEVQISDGPDQRLRISFRDHGPGIAPELLGRISEPFFTTKTRGLGLGLAMARRIVERFGGKLEIGNADRGGALVRIELSAA
jgi:two-component system, NtrC family, sensor histidine kinase HydH